MVSVQRPDLGSVWTLRTFPPCPSGRSCPAPGAQNFIRAAGISVTGPLWPRAAWFGGASWACVRANAFPSPPCPLRPGLYVRFWVSVSICEVLWLLNQCPNRGALSSTVTLLSRAALSRCLSLLFPPEVFPWVIWGQ